MTVRRRTGLTLLELLIAAGLAVTILTCIWLAFLSTFRRVRDSLSLSAAIQSAAVLGERFSRDVEEMVFPPCLGDRPMRISSDATAITFYVPDRTRRVGLSGAVAVPVSYHLLPSGPGTYSAARDGRPIAGVTLKDWQFAYAEAGSVRKSEALVGYMSGPGTGAYAGDLGLQAAPVSAGMGVFPRESLELDAEGKPRKPSWYAGPTFVWGQGPSVSMPSTVPASATTVTSGSPLGKLIPGLVAANPLEHAGPFLLMRFTVTDSGGSSIRRAMVFDLVNAHMMGHHGRDFPFPEWALELRGALAGFTTHSSTGLAAPIRKDDARPRAVRDPDGSGPGDQEVLP